MPHSVRCPCLGHPDCKLCGGTKFYTYQPGERGWMPFPRPTCEGKHEGKKTDPVKPVTTY